MSRYIFSIYQKNSFKGRYVWTNKTRDYFDVKWIRNKLTGDVKIYFQDLPKKILSRVDMSEQTWLVITLMSNE